MNCERLAQYKPDEAAATHTVFVGTKASPVAAAKLLFIIKPIEADETELKAPPARQRLSPPAGAPGERLTLTSGEPGPGGVPQTTVLFPV